MRKIQGVDPAHGDWEFVEYKRASADAAFATERVPDRRDLLGLPPDRRGHRLGLHPPRPLTAAARARRRRGRPAAPAAPRSSAPPGTTGAWCGARAAPPDPRRSRSRSSSATRPGASPAANRRSASRRSSGHEYDPGRPRAAGGRRRPAPDARPAPGAEPASGTPPPPTPATARPRSPAPPASPGTPRSDAPRTATPRPRREGAAPPAPPPPGPCTAGTAAGSPAALPCRSSSPCRDPEWSPPPRSPPTRAGRSARGVPGCVPIGQRRGGQMAKTANTSADPFRGHSSNCAQASTTSFWGVLRRGPALPRRAGRNSSAGPQGRWGCFAVALRRRR